MTHHRLSSSHVGSSGHVTPGSQIVTAQLTDCCDKSLDETNVKAEIIVELSIAIMASKIGHLPV